MPRYLLRVTPEDAARLESWLGTAIRLVPGGPDDILAGLRTEGGWVPDHRRAEADRRLAAREPVVVAGLDAITEAEYEAAIAPRLRTSGPLYHAGGPG